MVFVLLKIKIINHRSGTASKDVVTYNDSFSCQIADFYAGWSSNATEDVIQLSPKRHRTKLNKLAERVFPYEVYFGDAVPLDPPPLEVSFEQAK